MIFTSTKLERFNRIARITAVYFLMAMFFLLNATHFSWFVINGTSVPLVLMAIYYWAIYRPTLVPEWLMFVVGILLDLLSGMPVGISAFIFVAIRWSVSKQRLFLMGQPFIMVWFGFVLTGIAYGLMSWVLFGFLQFHWTPLRPVALSVVLGAILFPVVNMVLHLTHKILPEQPGNFTPK